MVEQPIRNRQVASSTLALGSNILLKLRDMLRSIDRHVLTRCTNGARSQFFAARVHRVHLRFVHGLHVDVLGHSDIAVAQNGLKSSYRPRRERGNRTPTFALSGVASSFHDRRSLALRRSTCAASHETTRRLIGLCAIDEPDTSRP